MPSVATQRLVLAKVLSLPSPVLRLMSGGGVVYQGGRTLDPRLQYIAAQARSAPPITRLRPEEARAANGEGLALMAGAPEPGVRWEPLAIPGPAVEVPARLFRPAAQDPQAPLM